MRHAFWPIIFMLVGAATVASTSVAAADSGATVTIEMVPDEVAPRVTWDVGSGADVATGQLYVSADGRPETLFAEGPRGSKPAPWISSASRYRFTLYAGTVHANLIAETSIEPGQSAPVGSSTGDAKSAPSGWTPPDVTAVLATPRVQTLVGTFGVLLVILAGCLVTARLVPRSRNWVLRIAALAAIGWALVPVVTAEPRPLAQQPFPDSPEYADGALQLELGNGYVTLVHGSGPEPPRYPPGVSAALFPFVLVGDYPENVQRGSQLYTALYVVSAAAVAWKVGGANAGLLTALVIGASPFTYISSSLVLSDALSAALTLPLAWLVRGRALGSGVVSGALVGLLTTIRLTGLLALPAVLISGSARFRNGVLLGIALPLLLLALYQWQTFGSPLRTGYDYWLPGVKNFDLAYATATPPFGDGPWVFPDALGGSLMAWTCPCGDGGPQGSMPNLSFYPTVLLGLFWVFSPPLIGLLGLAVAWMRRRDPTALFMLAYLAVNATVMILYFYQGTRFMAAAASLLAIEASVGSAQLLTKLPDGFRGFALTTRLAYASPRSWPAWARRGRESAEGERIYQ